MKTRWIKSRIIVLTVIMMCIFLGCMMSIYAAEEDTKGNTD